MMSKWLLPIVLLFLSTGAHAVELPQYQLRDTFIYDNGRVEQIVDDKDGALVWSTLGGRQYVRDRNFLLPLLQWQTIESSGTRRASATARSLWPLTPGKTVRFRMLTDASVQRGDRQPQRRRFSELWTCRTLEPAPIRVPAGTFDALEIRCERFSPRTMRVIRQEQWYYAPDVGHYVQRRSVDLVSGKRTTFALVATLSGLNANPRRIRSILTNL